MSMCVRVCLRTTTTPKTLQFNTVSKGSKELLVPVRHHLNLPPAQADARKGFLD